MLARSLVTLVIALVPFAVTGVAAAEQLNDEELRRWVEHILELEERVSHHGDDVQLMIRLTDAYIRIGDARRAGPALERLADLGVEPLRIALLRGDLELGLGDHDRAARAYLDALSMAPHQTHALSQLWRLMLEVTLADAQVAFDRATVIETLQREGLFFPGAYTPSPDGPERAARLVDRASAMVRRGSAEEAVVLLTQAIAIDPGNADAFAALARAHASDNDPRSAIGAFLVYLILAPDAPDAPRVRQYIGREIERANLR